VDNCTEAGKRKISGLVGVDNSRFSVVFCLNLRTTILPPGGNEYIYKKREGGDRILLKKERKSFIPPLLLFVVRRANEISLYIRENCFLVLLELLKSSKIGCG